MKFGYQTITWGGIVGHYAGVISVRNAYYLSYGPLPQALDDILKAGYSGFETFDGNVEPYFQKRKEFQDMITRRGLELASVYSGASYIHPNRVEDEIAKITEVAEFVAAVGSERIVVGGGEIRREGTKEEDYRNLAKALNKIGKICNNLGIEAAYHPHLGTIVQDKNQLAKLCKLTDPDLVHLCPDTAHLVAGGSDPVEVIKSYGDRIDFVHFKDFKNGTFLELGKGNLDFPAIMKALKSAGYDGWIIVELDYTSRTPVESARMSKQYIDLVLKK